MSDTTRPLLEAEHEAFRATVRAFMEKEVSPSTTVGARRPGRPRGLGEGRRGGTACFDVDEEYGGAGVRDFRYNVVLAEEIPAPAAAASGFPVHNDSSSPTSARWRTTSRSSAGCPAGTGDRSPPSR